MLFIKLWSISTTVPTSDNPKIGKDLLKKIEEFPPVIRKTESALMPLIPILGSGSCTQDKGALVSTALSPQAEELLPSLGKEFLLLVLRPYHQIQKKAANM